MIINPTAGSILSSDVLQSSSDVLQSLSDVLQSSSDVLQMYYNHRATDVIITNSDLYHLSSDETLSIQQWLHIYPAMVDHSSRDCIYPAIIGHSSSDDIILLDGDHTFLSDRLVSRASWKEL